MRCSACGLENPDNLKFCTECGSPLKARCPKCGFENTPQAKFCGQCAEPLAKSHSAAAAGSAAPSSRAIEPARAEPDQAHSVAERRHLTVLFCDLVGSTEIAAHLDPEDWRDVAAQYQRAAGDAVTRFRGHVAQYQGDGLVVYFGYPHAHDNDAEHAVRAGLAILEAMTVLNRHFAEQQRRGLAVRVGIHTGSVVAAKENPMKSRREIPSIALLVFTLAACHHNGSNSPSSPGPQALGQNAPQVVSGQSHNRRVFVTEASLPPGSYNLVEEIEVGSVWYGSVVGLMDALALEGQKKGADAVIEVKKGHHVTALSWAAPHAIGKAVRFKNPCAFNPSSVPGEYLPQGGAEPITAACKTPRASVPSAPAPSHPVKAETAKRRAKSHAAPAPATEPGNQLPELMPPR